MTPKEVLTLIREKQVKAVDLRFTDFPGTWQHVTTPAANIDESTFEALYELEIACAGAESLGSPQNLARYDLHLRDLSARSGGRTCGHCP